MSEECGPTQIRGREKFAHSVLAILAAAFRRTMPAHHRIGGTMDLAQAAVFGLDQYPEVPFTAPSFRVLEDRRTEQANIYCPPPREHFVCLVVAMAD